MNIMEEHKWFGDDCLAACSVCGVKQINYIMNPSSRHKWSGDTCKDYCLICGEKQHAPHNYVLIDSGTEHGQHGRSYRDYSVYRCTICGKEYSEIYEHDNWDGYWENKKVQYPRKSPYYEELRQMIIEKVEENGMGYFFDDDDEEDDEDENIENSCMFH